jgi:general stress protein YciG
MGAKGTGTGRHPKRGFASMDAALRSTIATLGGVAAHKARTAHEWTPETAAVAGRKGGQASVAARRRRKLERKQAS